MSPVVIVVFASSYIAAIVYLVSLGLFFNRLKTVSPADHERLGSPTLLSFAPEHQRSLLKNFPQYFRFLALRKYREVDDVALTRWGATVRMSFVLSLIGISGTFVWFISVWPIASIWLDVGSLGYGSL